MSPNALIPFVLPYIFQDPKDNKAHLTHFRKDRSYFGWQKLNEMEEDIAILFSIFTFHVEIVLSAGELKEKRER